MRQKGFTLIELVVVIVILGILAATALPRFINLSDDAELAAVAGVAGGLSSASSINYAGCMVASGNAAKCTSLPATSSKCSSIGTLLQPPLALTVAAGTLTKGTYYITADTALTTSGVECELQLGGTAGAKAKFTGHATS